MNPMPTTVYLLLVVGVKLYVTHWENMPEMLMETDECEVHCNTMEGIWVGLRNFLRPFRGIHKQYLHLYVGIFE